jgi:HK97 family phage prohead protease
MNERLLAAAAARAAGTAAVTDRPRERRWCEDVTGSRGAVLVRLDPQRIRSGSLNGHDGTLVGGVASTTEDPYEMYDFFGPYTEITSSGCFEKTLARTDLLTEYVVNHGAGGSLPMAHTRNGTLQLVESDEGLDWTAVCDPQRNDVNDMVLAMMRGDLVEASFRFRIVRGQWSPDYTEYRIDEVDLHRGDVSAVNFGANPHASSGLRAAPVVPVQTPREVASGLDDTQARELFELLAPRCRAVFPADAFI